MNNLEVESAIDEELTSNPALEREPAAFETGGGAEPVPAPAAETIDWQEYFESAGEPGSPETEEPYYDPLANKAGPPVTLAAYLRRQLEVVYADDERYDLALAVTGALDEDGYFRDPPAAFAAAQGVGEEEVVAVLTEIVQRLDPPGVGARDLREALFLQWRAAADEAPPLAGVLIADHLGEIPKRTAEEFAASLGVPPEEVAGALAFIRSLEPRPGRPFGGEANVAVVPDLSAELSGGRLKITFLDEPSGRLYVSPLYRELLAPGAPVDEKTRRYLRARVAAAAWFVRALHQRRRTMEKVARAVFERQRDFLTKGAEGLKPLTMDGVAGEVDLHVSTVSRAVAGKTVDTPVGIFPLKYFFTASARADEGDFSVGRVKAVLADIVAAEDPRHSLSDEELAAALAARGVHIARRTVAKYRTQLKIPGKHERTRRV